jgi:hypothetical protein
VVISGIHGPNALRMAVVPNPMSDAARVVFSEALSADARIELVDASGRVLRTLNGNGSSTVVIERGHLESGLYVLRVFAKTGHVPNARLIIH